MNKIDFGAPEVHPRKTITDVLGAAVPAQPTFKKALSSPSTLDMKRDVLYKLLPGLVAAGAGAMLWKKHRWLGGLGGLAVGSSAHSVVTGENRTKALCAVGATGLGILASLKWKKHPALGYIGGSIAGSALSSPFWNK